jgi:protein-S-isoprenylcysteine O-methyltransferase Ste14
VSIADRLQQHRVSLGWVFAAAFLVFARPTPPAIAAGALLFALGAAVRTWAAGHIRKREVLAVTGPYAHTRNPLYFGSFLMACGTLVMGRNGWLAAGFLLVAVPVYHVVIRKEEALLLGIFGEAFVAYMRDVPRFFPRLAVPSPGRGSFDWALVRRHREWRAWVGGVLLALLLLARWHWMSGR